MEESLPTSRRGLTRHRDRVGGAPALRRETRAAVWTRGAVATLSPQGVGFFFSYVDEECLRQEFFSVLISHTYVELQRLRLGFQYEIHELHAHSRLF